MLIILFDLREVARFISAQEPAQPFEAHGWRQTVL